MLAKQPNHHDLAAWPTFTAFTLIETPRLCCDADRLLAHFRSSAQPVEFVLQAEVAKWKKRDSQKLRNLPGLMQLLQAKERPEADQPEVMPGSMTLIDLDALCSGEGGKGLCCTSSIQMTHC